VDQPPLIAWMAWLLQHSIGFVSVVLVVLGLWFLFSREGRRYAVLGFGFLGVLGLMMALAKFIAKAKGLVESKSSEL
jgi:uncharacterized membrane protein YwaF